MASKYDRLGETLAASGAATISVTFATIEAVVGPLPKAARRRAIWWRATPGAAFRHPLNWRRAGYVADLPDFAAQTVTFRRVVR